MKIIISSQGEEKNSLMDSRFGRCAFFYIYDLDTNIEKIIPNIAASASGGAGIQAANAILKENADIVITGNMGPNAKEVLKNANIKILTSDIKPVYDIINDYKQNKLINSID